MDTIFATHSRTLLLTVSCAVACQAACIETDAEPHAKRDAAALAFDAGRERPPTGEALWLPDCGSLLTSIKEMHEQRLATSIDGSTGDPALATNAGVRNDAAVPDEAHSPARGAFTPSAAGQVIVTEIMADPRALADTAGEWIELHNPSRSESAELQGCALDDGGTQRALTEPLRIAPEGFATIARTSSPGFAPDAVLALSLANTADAITLLCSGVEIDRVAYDASFPIAAGASMALDPSALDAEANDDASAWCLATQAYSADLGTPGKPNPGCFDDAGVE